MVTMLASLGPSSSIGRQPTVEGAGQQLGSTHSPKRYLTVGKTSPCSNAQPVFRSRTSTASTSARPHPALVRTPSCSLGPVRASTRERSLRPWWHGSTYLVDTRVDTLEPTYRGGCRPIAPVAMHGRARM